MEREKFQEAILRLKKQGEVFSVDNAFLAPITFDYRLRLPECVELLSRWRIENPSLSPARFPVSLARTERWLNSSILNNKDRVMFMIQNHSGKNIGHIGLSGIDYDAASVRIDSVLKGIKHECPGIMGNVIEFLKCWCRDELEARLVDLVVLDDNSRAIDLYHRCGFIDDRVIPLQKIEDNGEINWVENDTLEYSEKRFIHMVSYL